MAKIRSCSIIIFLILLVSHTLFSAGKFGFADYLFSKQQYYRAITEYERYLYNNPDSKYKDEAAYKIGLCYLYGEQYNDAINYFYNYLEDFSNSKYSRDAFLKIVDAYYIIGNYDDAIFELEDFSRSTTDKDMKIYSKFYLGKLYFYKYEWDKAYNKWKEVKTKYNLMVDKYMAMCQEGKKLPHKSPVVAGGLSMILPGLGQIYTGDYGDALAVFLVNGIFGYLIYDAVVEKNYVRLGIWSFLEFGWYSGTVYGAIRGAERYNLRQKEQFVKSIEINIRF